MMQGAGAGRFVMFLGLALLLNAGLFLTMENMISQERVRVIDALEANTIDFVRTAIDDQTKTKDRRRKPPPKPQEIKRPQARMDPNIAGEAAQLARSLARGPHPRDLLELPIGSRQRAGYSQPLQYSSSPMKRLLPLRAIA